MSRVDELLKNPNYLAKENFYTEDYFIEALRPLDISRMDTSQLDAKSLELALMPDKEKDKTDIG